jgi:hypothetical protein
MPIKRSIIDILGLTDKPIIPAHCRFPLTNLHFAESLDVVPESNLSNQLNLLCICSANQNNSHIKMQLWATAPKSYQHLPGLSRFVPFLHVCQASQFHNLNHL